ncbi:MAG: hypothetical protein KF861_02275, partial [Planctomycetaceae bacterium]|nr:hypothetical protein [Planctomycetaceae bacterium]
MRNAPLLRLEAGSSEDSDRSQPVLVGVPAIRIALLMLVLVAPTGAVSARLWRLQGQLTGEFAAAWQTTKVNEESIPCRDGRILSADGQVLAHDRLRSDLHVHYRWLEVPVDERWLMQQALARLSRQDRRRPALVEHAKQSVLNDRDRLWERLATILNRPQAELAQARSVVQQRVERVVASVTQRREERSLEQERQSQLAATQLASHTSPLSPQWWDLAGQTVVDQLTTAPRRERLDPVIVQEELQHHVIALDIGLDCVTAIESAPSLFPGVLVRTARERVYPQADVAGHIIGVRTPLKPDEMTSGASSNATDHLSIDSEARIGRDGIERALDARLRGRPGVIRIVRDRGGEVISQEVVQNAVPGEDVVLTIDLSLQRTAERLLDAAISPPSEDTSQDIAGLITPQGACLVVLDVRTGEVLTAAAAPRHNLQLLTRPDPSEWQAAVADTRRPFFPRVTQMTVPPGSVFKILTSVALLESGRMDPDEPFYCQGYLDRPDRNRCYVFRHYGVGHGDVTLADAICQSCNVYFFHAAQLLGPAAISEWAGRFGLGEPTGTEVPGERRGHLPQTDQNGRITGEQWYSGSTLQLAIGQASLTVTPLQVTRMVAAVANGGYLVTPQFVAPRASHLMPSPEAATYSGVHLVGYESETSLPLPERIPGLSDET